MKTAKKTKQQDTPVLNESCDELWLLVITDGRTVGRFVRTLDCGGDPLVAYRHRDDAEAGAKAANDQYEICCVPIRIL